MSETTVKSGGSATKGVLVGMTVCAVLSVGVMAVFPVDTAPPPVAQVSDEEISFDAPDVLDNAAGLVPPGQDVAIAQPQVDTTPTAPAKVRDVPVASVEQNAEPVEPVAPDQVATTPVIEPQAPDIDVAIDKPIANAAPDEPTLTAEEAATRDSPAPEFPVLGEATLDAPNEETAEVETPTPEIAAIATFAAADPLGTDQSESISVPRVDPQADAPAASLDVPAPEAASSDPSVTLDAIELATPQPAEPAPLDAASTPLPSPDLDVASVSVPPHADNPVARKPVLPDAENVPQGGGGDGPAFEENAADFDPQPNKPFLAIVIEDVGADGVPPGSLTDLAVPVTISLGSGNASATTYRQRGFELVARLLGEDGKPLKSSVDSEKLLSRIAATRNEFGGSVAIIEPQEGDLYRNARLISSLAEELSTSGHGILVFERFGAGPAVAAARATGTPTGAILRVLDENRDAGAIRRALDRAALEASKTGSAIVYAHSYPETLAALLPWLLSNTARSIQLAPLTATMKKAEAG